MLSLSMAILNPKTLNPNLGTAKTMEFMVSCAPIIDPKRVGTRDWGLLPLFTYP